MKRRSGVKRPCIARNDDSAMPLVIGNVNACMHACMHRNAGSTAFVMGLTRAVAVNCVFLVAVNTFATTPAHQKTVPIVSAVFAKLLNAIIHHDIVDGSGLTGLTVLTGLTG